MESEYNYWIERKKAYENSLSRNIGHTPSIQILLEKINKKLDTIIKNDHL